MYAIIIKEFLNKIPRYSLLFTKYSLPLQPQTEKRQMQKIQSRQQALREIISSEQVFSQEDLMAKLSERGISATQATLSRDLKALHIIKVPHQGYKLSQTTHPTPSGLGIGITGVEINLPITVIRTQVGFAPAVATFLDRHPLPPVMGTVAGDDTVMIVSRKGFNENQILDALSKILPDIRDRYVVSPEAD
jgi:transcriptional regulator of arginine metabolism